MAATVSARAPQTGVGDVARLGPALAVVAHPDDESFGLGAVLAALVSEGTDVRVLCLTHGEASTLGAAADDLGQTRRGELARAAQQLGVTDVNLQDFPDGGLQDVGHDILDHVVDSQIGDAAMLVVFEPGGVTGHPDHRAATASAYRMAARRGLTVLEWGVAPAVAAALNAELATTFTGLEGPGTFDINVDRRGQQAAIACHQSQAHDNPVLVRRLDLAGDRERLRLRPSAGDLDGHAGVMAAQPRGGSEPAGEAYRGHETGGVRRRDQPEREPKTPGVGRQYQVADGASQPDARQPAERADRADGSSLVGLEVKAPTAGSAIASAPGKSVNPGGSSSQQTAWLSWLRRALTGRGELMLLAVMSTGLAAGAALRLAGLTTAGPGTWAATTTAAILLAGWWVIDAARHRRIGVDVVALLALGGTLIVGEYLAGAVIAVMLASGRSLEAWAAGRSQRELRALLDRAPHSAHRRQGLMIVDVAVDTVGVGDLLMVKPGEVIPVDGLVEAGTAVVDESALTGESLPIERGAGDMVRSGTVNAAGAFDMRAITTAAQSSYAGIVRLVATAEASTAPVVRLADRYAVGFLALTLAGAGAAWAGAGLARAVAVLVVATPCPLILAVPVALVSGLSRAAHRGVIVKGGAVLERLAQAKVLLFDKTGTLTAGRPTVAEVVTAGDVPADEVLRLAASLDQVSPHVLGAAVVRAAHQRGLILSLPAEVEEVAGRGVRGVVEGRRVALGKAAWVSQADAPTLRAIGRRADRDGMLSIFVAVDGRPAGALFLVDPIRADAARTIRRLRADGIGSIIMVTGDRADVADSVGAVIGVDEVLADRTPADKVDAVTVARRGGPTIMVGDGINDAPALAMADVGVAIGARGATASSEAADIVLTVDRLDRLGEAVVIARRALRIATQSVVAGIGLSVTAMAIAGAGYLPATWGAITQEVIDVAVILNALRVLQPGRGDRKLDEDDAALARRFSAEHVTLRQHIEKVRAVADAVGVAPADRAVAMVRDVHRLLVEEVLPHEQAEDSELYPMLARVLGGADPTATMTRAHVEIAHLVRRVGRLLDDIDAAGPDNDDLIELRRLLYGLHAILGLHTSQEDESYLSLADEEPARPGDDKPLVAKRST